MALLLRRLGRLEPQDRGLVHRLSPRRHIGRQRARHGLRNRRPAPGGNVHADHGTPFTSWVFGDKIRTAGLLPSFGTVGDGLDNAMMENFWSCDADRVAQPQTLANPGRTRERDLRVHRDLPQPPAPSLSTGLPHPGRVRTTRHNQPRPRCQLATRSGTQPVGQVKLSPICAADPFVQQTPTSVRSRTSTPTGSWATPSTHG